MDKHLHRFACALLLALALSGAHSAPAQDTAPRDGQRPRPEEWTRVGDLASTLQRVADAFPLSDQTNEAGWKPYAPMSDEFEASELDPAKWWPYNPTWKGRPPAPFLRKNVRLESGELHLTMRRETDLPPEFAKIKDRDGKPVFHSFSSASVKSKDTVRYGYFEIEARAMDSAGSSAFWFTGRTEDERGRWRTEIDVFEIGGNAKGFERRYNMNVHVFETPEEKRHWSRHGRWVAPWRLADDYHVYGLEWDADWIRYYVDGVLVRRVENTHWHQPLHLLFDSETMPNWFGLPDPDDLPSTYSIRYVRAWKK